MRKFLAAVGGIITFIAIVFGFVRAFKEFNLTNPVGFGDFPYTPSIAGCLIATLVGCIVFQIIYEGSLPLSDRLR
jgi:hypothetical protein